MFQKVWGKRKIFCINGVTLFRRKLFVSQCRKFLWRNPTVVEKNSGFKKFLRMKTGGVSHFSVEKIWSRSAENICEHPCLVSEKMWYRENLRIIVVSRFSLENSLSHSAENIRGHSFKFSEKFGYRKKLCVIRVSQFSAGNCLSHSAENFCEGVPLFSRKFLIPKTVYGWKGERITYFCRNILVP